MSVRRSIGPVTALVIILCGVLPAPAFAQSGGLKGGFLYSSLSFDRTSDIFDSHNGWTAGIFFGSRRDRAVGLQSELNLLRKGGNDGVGDVRLYYLQVPVLVRVAAGGGIKVFAVTGPAFDVKIAESSPEAGVVRDWAGIDVGFMAGAGFELGRLIIEGRGTWGLRNIARSVANPFEGETLTTRTFAIQAGLRFK